MAWRGFLQYYLNGYVLISGILILLVLLVVLRRRGRSWTYLGFFSFFWMYLVLLVSMAIFSGIYFRAESWAERVAATPQVLSRVNLVPFGAYHTITRFSQAEMTANVLMTIPLGFGLGLLTTVRFWRMVVIAVLTGLTFELSQLLLSLYAASPTRAIDITDVILNAAGVLVGYGLFRLLALAYLSVAGRARATRRGLGAFLHDAARARQGEN